MCKKHHSHAQERFANVPYGKSSKITSVTLMSKDIYSTVNVCDPMALASFLDENEILRDTSQFLLKLAQRCILTLLDFSRHLWRRPPTTKCPNKRPPLLTADVPLDFTVERSVASPGLEIEWSIIWLLSASHRKHIFVPQKIVEAKRINIDANRLTRRAEWAWAFRKDSAALPRITTKTREVVGCTKTIPPIVKYWPTGIRNARWTETTKERSEGINKRLTNETLLLRWSGRRLRASSRTAVQSHSTKKNKV